MDFLPGDLDLTGEGFANEEDDDEDVDEEDDQAGFGEGLEAALDLAGTGEPG